MTPDPLNRLTSAGSGTWGESYTYDGFGNLTDKTVTAGSAPTLHVTVNAATNRMNSYGYIYDANGNLSNAAYMAFTYDAANRVMTGTWNAATDTYAYGPDNLRVWKLKPDGTEEIYYYDAAGRRLGSYQVIATGGGGSSATL